MLWASTDQKDTDWNVMLLDVFPDGGMARLRLWAALTNAARDDLALRWFNLLPESQMGFVGLARNEETHEPEAYMASLPE